MTNLISQDQRRGLLVAFLGTLQQMVAMAGALSAVFAIGFWLVEPRLQDWVRAVAVDPELRSNVVANRQQIDEIRNGLAEVARALDRLEVANRGIDAAPLEFLERGNEISHARVGGEVVFIWYFRKIHDCGAPSVNAFFEDSRGVMHRFTSLSIVDAAGIGVNASPDPSAVQSITYSGFLPAGNHVAVGVAHGWVNLSYKLCPLAPEVRSPRVRFQILGSLVESN